MITKSNYDRAPVQVKICGIRREEDAAFVNEAGADFAGLIFAKGRRRAITFEQAAHLSRLLKADITPVGVFVDEPVENIVGLVERGVIRAVQLHGHEDNAYITTLREKLSDIDPTGTGRHGTEPQGDSCKRSGVMIIKACSLTDETAASQAAACAADMLLIDSGRGGTGERADLSLLGTLDRPFWLAGGLGPENVREILTQIRQQEVFRWLRAVDTSSGTEKDGVKDREKILAFTEAVRGLR